MLGLWRRIGYHRAPSQDGHLDSSRAFRSFPTHRNAVEKSTAQDVTAQDFTPRKSWQIGHALRVADRLAAACIRLVRS